jgi:hypothetical protein
VETEGLEVPELESVADSVNLDVLLSTEMVELVDGVGADFVDDISVEGVFVSVIDAKIDLLTDHFVNPVAETVGLKVLEPVCVADSVSWDVLLSADMLELVDGVGADFVEDGSFEVVKTSGCVGVRETLRVLFAETDAESRIGLLLIVMCCVTVPLVGRDFVGGDGDFVYVTTSVSVFVKRKSVSEGILVAVGERLKMEIV